MPTTRKTIEPVRNAAGKLLGFYEHTDTLTPVRMSKGRPVDPPPLPPKQLRTATPTTPTRKPTPARPPTPSPVAFLSKHMGRVVTLTHCCACQKTHASCQCWPSGSARELAAEAAAAAVPRTRENTFSVVVRRQQELGLRPGETSTTTPPAPETTLQAVVRLQKERGLR